MATPIYRCPTTGMNVQGWFADEVAEGRRARIFQHAMRGERANPPSEPGDGEGGRRSRRLGRRQESGLGPSRLFAAAQPYVSYRGTSGRSADVTGWANCDPKLPLTREPRSFPIKIGADMLPVWLDLSALPQADMHGS
jgi:hypothetical protein